MTQRLHWLTLKKWIKRIAIIFAVLYILGVLDRSFPGPPECPVEEHAFADQKFDIEFCHRYVSDRQYIGIGVYSKDGALLAWRWATFANESPLNYMAIEATQIRYSDDPLNNEEVPADCVLHMPPTGLDWLEARLPGGIPGVGHCGKATQPEIRKARDQWNLRVAAEEKKKRAQSAPAHQASAAATTSQ